MHNLQGCRRRLQSVTRQTGTDTHTHRYADTQTHMHTDRDRGEHVIEATCSKVRLRLTSDSKQKYIGICSTHSTFPSALHNWNVYYNRPGFLLGQVQHVVSFTELERSCKYCARTEHKQRILAIHFDRFFFVMQCP